MEKRCRALFENALDAILMVGDDGRYLDANPAAVELLGYTRDELLSLTAWDLTPASDLEAAKPIWRAFAERGSYAGDYRLLRKDGTIREAEFRSVANILPGVHLAVVRDVTERRQAETELRRSRELFEEAESVAHIGSWEWDLETDELKWSRELYRLFGVAPGAFRPSYASSLERIHPEDCAFVDEVCQRSARNGTDYAYDARLVRPDGKVRFMHARGHSVRDGDGQVVRMLGIAQDITERKREEGTRRALMSRLIASHEEERARISRELHDGTGQALAALLMGLRRIEDSNSLKEIRAVAARERGLVAQALDDLGRLARGLRPIVLDDLGLRAALERHASDQAWLFGFEVTLDAEGLGQRRLPRDVETAFYRVAQEALANAARHASPRHVRISIERDRQGIRLAISDDGCGFDVDRVPEGGAHLGLHGIRERAALVGGRAEVHSKLGEGTRVSVLVPLPDPASSPAAATRGRKSRAVRRSRLRR